MSRKAPRKNTMPAFWQTAIVPAPGDDDPILAWDYIWSVERFREDFPDEELCGPFYDRSSGRGQKENPKVRKPIILRECKRRGVRIPAYFWEIEKGYSNLLYERRKLIEAAKYAHENNMPLFVFSLNRLLRCIGEIDDPLTRGDMRRFKRFLKSNGVPQIRIVCLVPPDTPPEKVRSEFVRIGHEATGNKGGRGKTAKPDKAKLPSPVGRKKETPSPPGEMKQRWEKFLPIVKKLAEMGLSTRKISKKIMEDYDVYISSSSVCEWLNQEKKHPPEKSKVSGF